MAQHIHHSKYNIALMRRVLAMVLCLAAWPAYAGPVDELSKAIFDEDSSSIKIKKDYRKCSNDSDCTAILSLCRWRAVSALSEKHVRDMSDQVILECKWPKPPATPPIPRCVEQLCEILSDGKHY